MRKMYIQYNTSHKYGGHRELDIDEDIDLARQLFDEALEAGKMAIATKGGVKEIIHEFDPEADEIRVVLPLVGG